MKTCAKKKNQTQKSSSAMSNSKRDIAKKNKQSDNPPLEKFSKTRDVGKKKYQHTDPSTSTIVVGKRKIPYIDPSTPIDFINRLDHLLDTVSIAKFLVNIIEVDGTKILFDALEFCKDVDVPFMTAMVEYEYTMYQHEVGVWNRSQCQDPPLEPGDRVTRTRDLVEFRVFMNALILNNGVECIEKLVEGQCPLVTQVFDLEKNSYFLENKMYDRITTVNEKGKHVVDIPIDFRDMRSDAVIIQQVSFYPALEMVAKEMKVVDVV